MWDGWTTSGARMSTHRENDGETRDGRRPCVLFKSSRNGPMVQFIPTTNRFPVPCQTTQPDPPPSPYHLVGDVSWKALKLTAQFPIWSRIWRGNSRPIQSVYSQDWLLACLPILAFDSFFFSRKEKKNLVRRSITTSLRWQTCPRTVTHIKLVAQGSGRPRVIAS